MTCCQIGGNDEVTCCGDDQVSCCQIGGDDQVTSYRIGGLVARLEGTARYFAAGLEGMIRCLAARLEGMTR